MDERDIEIISYLQYELENTVDDGLGPFMAAIYDRNYKLIAKAKNTVVKDKCSVHHAEINAIIKAEKYLKTYNLANYDLGIYITSEPCMMCLGAIMWSGIRRIYFSTSSENVQKITGFDEGYKPNWITEFKRRGFEVHPYILPTSGIRALEKYKNIGGIVYKPYDNEN